MPLSRRHENINLKRIYVIAETDAGAGTAADPAPDPAPYYLSNY